MNVASLENCKRLYELSGWGNKLGETDFYAVNKNGEQVAFVRQGQVIGELSLFEWVKSIPAYDSGYLLRKCAERDIAVSVEYVGIGGSTSLSLKEWYGKFIASTPHMKQGDYPIADTPEDALCLLAIKLIEDKVLEP